MLNLTEGQLYRGQHGEDRVLEERFSGKRGGYYVEVGALDGETFSNSYYFEYALGWRGLLVEANPVEAERARQNRPHSEVVAKAVVQPSAAGGRLPFTIVDGFPALSTFNLTGWARTLVDDINVREEKTLTTRCVEVETATLDAVLQESGAPATFDFITIDVEGYEWQALRGFSLGSRWQPTVFMIENGSGLVDLRILSYLYRAGYGYQRSIGHNDWYERVPPLRRLRGAGRLYTHSAPWALRMLIRRCLKALHLLALVRRLRGRGPASWSPDS